MDSSPLGFYSRINSDDTDSRLFAERIKLVFSHASAVASASLLAVAIVDVILWSETPPERLVVWTALVALTCFYGFLQIIRFERTRSVIENMVPWKRRLIGGSFVMGVLWGWACVYLPPVDSSIHQVFLILMAGCLAAGAASTYAAVIEAVLVFAIPALAPVAGIMLSGWLSRGEDIEATMGSVVLLYLMFLISVARRNNGVVCSTLKLRYENLDLMNQTQRSMLELSMARDSLAQSEDRFRNLAEASFEGVMLAENGFIIDFNGALLLTTGYTAEELGGKRALDLIVPDYHALMKRRLNADYADPAEVMLVAKNGSALPVEVRIKSANYKGSAIRVIAIRDIRERKKSEKVLLEAKRRAEEATRLKDMFVSLVAHDLKSPINSIMGLLRIFKSIDGAALAQAQRAEVVDSALESGSRMLEMIDELLNLSRLKTGKIIPIPKLVRTGDLAKMAILSHEQVARKKGISLKMDIDPAKTLYTDPDLLGQVLRNLVSNAVKFCRAGDSVTVSSPDGPTPVMLVSDNGPGIREEILLNIFRRGQKTSTDGSEGERGTGLGLPFSKDIMESLGGAMSIKTSPGGTSVYMYLPVRKPRVLLVDDDIASLDICKRKLRGMDLEIIETREGSDALKIIMEGAVDMIVSDVEMPGVDGFKILEAARNNEKTSGLPVILITGDTGRGGREKALQLGASEFLLKQGPPGELADIIRKRIGV